MDGYGKRILVIDDDAACRALLEDQLGQEGYAVKTVCDGKAGLEEMHKRHFDAVITDGQVPGLSGLEFVRFSRIAWPDRPVILVSSDANYFTCDAERSGTITCIHKPYEATLLLNVLRAATQHASADHATFSMRK